MILLITSIALLLLLAAAGIGAKFGMKLGREMAETKFIDHVNRHPLDYAFEVTDTLYPHRKPLMIEVREALELKQKHHVPILKTHFSLT